MKTNRSLKYKNSHYVYVHIDPRDRQVIYVGQGKGERAWIKYNRSKEHKNWVIELKLLNLLPIIKIVHVFKDHKDALIRERMLISFFQKRGNLLFNKNRGGGGHPGGPGHPWFGRPKTVEEKRKISEAQKGKPRPWQIEPTRQRMLGNSLRKGKKQPREAVESMRKTLIGNQYSSVKILCLNNQKTYNSVKEAWTELKLDERSVFRVLKGEYSHTKGFKFKYL